MEPPSDVICSNQALGDTHDVHRVHIMGTQNIADPLSHLMDGKAGPPEHKHEAEQHVS